MGHLLWLVCLGCSLVPRAITLTSSEVADMTTALEDMYSAIENLSDDEKHFPLAHQAVRLSFHDCVGGCDGCLNTNNQANAGLDNTVTKLEELWIKDDVIAGSSKISQLSGFSRADFWALAGVVALNFLSTCPKKVSGSCGDIEVIVTYRYGRTDCATAPTTTDTHTFPEGHGDWQHIRSFFSNEFGFTPKKTVAIMGAHTIGRGHAGVSGFKNRWVDKWDKVDNQYYIDLLDSNQGWENEDHQANPTGNGATTFWQWNEAGAGENMMLNADMSVIKEIDVNSATGEAGCTYGACLDSAGKTHAEGFKNSNQDWIDFFVGVFQEMIENGYTSAQMSTPS